MANDFTYSIVPPVAENYIIGVDVSKHQGKMNWQKCKDAGAKFAAIRCTVGNYYTDVEFERNYNGAMEVGLPVTVYHVVACASNNQRLTGKQNIDYFWSVLKNKHIDFPVALDCELSNGQDTRWVTSVVAECANMLTGEDFPYPLIYTAKGWWDANILPSSSWNKYPLWVANYTNAIYPAMPRDWNDWQIWQYSADGNNQGKVYGAQSSAIDKNRMKQSFWNKHIEPEDEIELPLPMKGTIRGEVLLDDVVYEYETELVR